MQKKGGASGARKLHLTFSGPPLPDRRPRPCPDVYTTHTEARAAHYTNTAVLPGPHARIPRLTPSLKPKESPASPSTFSTFPVACITLIVSESSGEDALKYYINTSSNCFQVYRPSYHASRRSQESPASSSILHGFPIYSLSHITISISKSSGWER